MADVPPASGSAPRLPTAPTRPLSGARAEAIRAAQKAFFDTALSAASPAATARPAAVQPAPAPGPTAGPAVTRLSFDAAAPAPLHAPRPGSLLDIKV